MTDAGPIAPVLLRAAELVEARGLAKRKAEDGQKICTQRAIHLAAHELREYPASIRSFRAAFHAFAVLQCGEDANAFAWNDHPDTTPEVAAAALRRAAESVSA